MIDDARSCGPKFSAEKIDVTEKKGRSRALRAGQPYLEFQLDPETLLEVECRARQRGVKTFEMCIILLREALAAPGQRTLD